MTPEAALFLAKSRELIERADTMLSVGLNGDAGRAAYLAELHAAQAFIFESTGRIFKKHSGVSGEFSRLTKHDPRVDVDVRAFLDRTYHLKAIADYETGPGAKIPAERAREAIQTARRFFECVTMLISSDGHVPTTPKS